MPKPKGKDDKDAPGGKPKDDKEDTTSRRRTTGPGKPKDPDPSKPKDLKQDKRPGHPRQEAEGRQGRREATQVEGQGRPEQGQAQADKDGPNKPRSKPDRKGPGKPKPRLPARVVLVGAGRANQGAGQEGGRGVKGRALRRRSSPVSAPSSESGWTKGWIRQRTDACSQGCAELVPAHQPHKDRKSTLRHHGHACNPSGPVTPGYTKAEDLNTDDYKEHTDYLKDEPDPNLPAPRIPKFTNGVLAKNFKAEFLNEKFGKAERAEGAFETHPGPDRLPSHPMSATSTPTPVDAGFRSIYSPKNLGARFSVPIWCPPAMSSITPPPGGAAGGFPENEVRRKGRSSG